MQYETIFDWGCLVVLELGVGAKWNYLKLPSVPKGKKNYGANL